MHAPLVEFFTVEQAAVIWCKLKNRIFSTPTKVEFYSRIEESFSIKLFIILEK